MFKFDADTPNVDSGVWADFGSSRFLIAHISNLKFQRALSRLQQPHRRKLESGTIDPKLNKELLCRAMSEGILLGWENVGSVNSAAPIDYTPESGFIALSKSVELRDFVTEFATNLANYRQEEVDELGNS